MKQEVLMGPERRRRWSDDEKISILIEASEPGVTVTEVARRHGISRQHIYQWRSDMRQGRLGDENGGPFLAVEFVGHPKTDQAAVETKGSPVLSVEQTTASRTQAGDMIATPGSRSNAT